jgi:hypothetical protein
MGSGDHEAGGVLLPTGMRLRPASSRLLCSNEIGRLGLALLTRRSGAKVFERLRYVHHIHRAASRRSYLPGRKVACVRVIVNRLSIDHRSLDLGVSHFLTHAPRQSRAGETGVLAGVYYSQRAPVPPMMTTINPSGILTIMI